MAPWDRSTPWAAKGRVAGPALLERGLELIEEWSQVLSVNLDGVWNCSQIFGRGMVARGHGSIIHGWRPHAVLIRAFRSVTPEQGAEP